MKKTLLALAVPAALAAGSASAAINLYNNNGVIVDIGGSAEVQFFKAPDETQDMTLRIDDGDFLVNTIVEIAPDLDAIAAIGFFFEDDNNVEAQVQSDELFVGLASTFGTLTYGRQYTITDAIGNGKDYELALGAVSYGDTLNSRVVKWFYDNGGMFYAGASTILDTDTTETSGLYGYDGVVGMRAAGFDMRVFGYAGYNMQSSFAEGNRAGLATSKYTNDITGFNFEVDYAYNAFDFSAGAGLVKYKAVGTLTGPTADSAPIAVNATTAGENKAMSYHVAAGFQADPRTYFAAGFYYLDTDSSGAYVDIKEHSFYTNVTYALHSNAIIYAELGINDRTVDKVEQPIQDLGYVLGMEVTF